MPVPSQKAIEISLAGDWTVAGIADRREQLAGYLDRIKKESSPAHETAPDRLFSIDMEGIESLDACGCQLLAVFVRDLHGMGIATSLSAITHEFRSIIATLGFAHCFRFAETGEGPQ